MSLCPTYLMSDIACAPMSDIVYVPMSHIKKT